MSYHTSPYATAPGRPVSPLYVPTGDNGDKYRRNGHGGRRRHRSKKPLVAVLVAVALVLIALAVYAALVMGSLSRVRAQAAALADLPSQVSAAVESGDYASLSATAHEAADAVAAVRDEIDGPLWGLAQAIPVVGGDVSSARRLVSAMDGLVSDALVPVADAASDALPLSAATDGSLDLSGVFGLCAAVYQAAPAVESASAAVEGIGSFRIGQLDDLLDELRGPLSELAEGLSTYGDLVGQLPSMLGSDGQTRTYLVIAQNNVEIRSTGGFPGAWCTVTVTNGQISVGEVSNIQIFLPWQPENPLAITDEERLVFGDRISYIPGDANYDPDFPRVAELWSQFWERQTGVHVDGIVAMDPQMLQALLAVVGPVQISDGSVLDGTNAAAVLSHDVYWNHMDDTDMMDACFAEAATGAVDNLTAMAGSLTADTMRSLADAVGQGVEDGHLVVWMADGAQQAALGETGCTGSLPDDPAEPVAGIYLADDTWAKMGWWLDLDAQVTSSWDNADGSRGYAVTVSLANVATWDEINACNAYMTGSNSLKYSVDDILTWIFLYAPAGGFISDVQVAGNVEGGGLSEATHDGLQVYYGLTHAQIGTGVTITYTVTTSPQAESELAFDITPTAQDVRGY